MKQGEMVRVILHIDVGENDIFLFMYSLKMFVQLLLTQDVSCNGVKRDFCTTDEQVSFNFGKVIKGAEGPKCWGKYEQHNFNMDFIESNDVVINL